MAFLTIAGTEYEVLTTNASRRAPERVGQVVRMFNGSLRSNIRLEKRSWSFTLRAMPLATFDALVALAANGALVTVGGDAIGGVDTQCVLEIGDSSYIDNAGTSFTVEPTVGLREA